MAREVLLLCTCLCTIHGASGNDSTVIRVSAGPNSLLHAQELVRRELSRRGAKKHSDSGDVVVRLGPGRHSVPLGGMRLNALDSGARGIFKVIWTGENNTIIDGGVVITDFAPCADNPALRCASAPASLLTAGAPATRQLFVGGVRYNRTRGSTGDLGLNFASGGDITPGGYKTKSMSVLEWAADPSSVEIVSDHTWVQHRCAVASVRAINMTRAWEQQHRREECSTTWGTKFAGKSPGPSLGLFNASSWEQCQQLCCQQAQREVMNPCKAIVFHPAPKPGQCYLLGRSFRPNFEPGPDSFAADLDPSVGNYVAEVNISKPCWDIARQPGYGQLQFPTFVENVGKFSTDSKGDWWLDRNGKRVVISPLAEHEETIPTAICAVSEALLHLRGTHDVVWQGVTFRHSTWRQPGQPSGFVERYGNVRFLDAAKKELEPAPAAVMIAAGRRIIFDDCKFERLGAWGMRIYSQSQDVTVRYSTFADLSGGAVSIGDVNDTSSETPFLPQQMTARIMLADNVVVHAGVEFKGAPALHTFCMANSSIEHNRITDVSYTGLSYNWPAPQGPTTTTSGNPPISTSSLLGYSANNRIVGNDVARFMSYMNDGGGIHTIGRSLNTVISRNYFHDMLAGTKGAHSESAQSIVYVDNWSCGLTIEDNVVDRCNGTKQGYYYFQNPRIALAHDNVIDGLYVRDGGHISGNGEQCNCSNVVIVPRNTSLPAAGQRVASQAGPRPRSSPVRCWE